MSNKVMSEVREKYVQRFGDMLNPLQTRLSELQQNLDSIKDDHPGKQKARLDVLTEINKTKEDIENTRKNLEYSKTIPINRSNKVPKNISDYNVWNDCWYDEERKAFVTFNKYFEESTNARTRDIQLQYDKETSVNSGIIIEEEKIQFRFGYPAIMQKDSDNKDVLFLLSTLTDDMLTKEIVVARLRPKSLEDSLLYETESEPWIAIGTRGQRLCEKENEISDELGLFPKVPLEELKSLYERK